MRLMIFFLLICFQAINSYADHVIWDGKVLSDGTPTAFVKLEIGKNYRIKVQGSANLGKWWQQGKPLASDACYEYADGVPPSKLEVLKNSMSISVCDGHYHPDHIYQSAIFKTKQSGIHFWMFDSDYTDNSGELQVQVIEITEK